MLAYDSITEHAQGGHCKQERAHDYQCQNELSVRAVSGASVASDPGGHVQRRHGKIRYEEEPLD
jgi:hypothetical protein